MFAQPVRRSAAAAPRSNGTEVPDPTDLADLRRSDRHGTHERAAPEWSPRVRGPHRPPPSPGTAGPPLPRPSAPRWRRSSPSRGDRCRQLRRPVGTSQACASIRGRAQPGQRDPWGPRPTPSAHMSCSERAVSLRTRQKDRSCWRTSSRTSPSRPRPETSSSRARSTPIPTPGRRLVSSTAVPWRSWPRR